MQHGNLGEWGSDPVFGRVGIEGSDQLIGISIHFRVVQLLYHSAVVPPSTFKFTIRTIALPPTRERIAEAVQRKPADPTAAEPREQIELKLAQPTCEREILEAIGT
jgi:hypothetical protein